MCLSCGGRGLGTEKEAARRAGDDVRGVGCVDLSVEGGGTAQVEAAEGFSKTKCRRETTSSWPARGACNAALSLPCSV